jgi:hypothetical protein
LNNRIKICKMMWMNGWLEIKPCHKQSNSCRQKSINTKAKKMKGCSSRSVLTKQPILIINNNKKSINFKRRFILCRKKSNNFKKKSTKRHLKRTNLIKNSRHWRKTMIIWKLTNRWKPDKANRWCRCIVVQAIRLSTWNQSYNLRKKH